jgi:hypothetical protein
VTHVIVPPDSDFPVLTTMATKTPAETATKNEPPVEPVTTTAELIVPDAATETAPETDSGDQIMVTLTGLRKAIDQLPQILADALAQATTPAAPAPATEIAATELSAQSDRIAQQITQLQEQNFTHRLQALATSGCIPQGEIGQHVRALVELSQAEASGAIEFSQPPTQTYLDQLANQKRGISSGTPDTSNGSAGEDPTAKWKESIANAWRS